MDKVMIKKALEIGTSTNIICEGDQKNSFFERRHTVMENRF
jgi:hypothetical protein